MTVNFVFNQAISYWTHNTTTSQKDNNNFNQKNSLKMCRWLHFELWKKTEIIRLNFFGLSKFDIKIKSDKNNTEFFLKKLTPLKVLTPLCIYLNVVFHRTAVLKKDLKSRIKSYKPDKMTSSSLESDSFEWILFFFFVRACKQQHLWHSSYFRPFAPGHFTSLK